MLSVSALRRFSAISNEVRVRVRGLVEQVHDGLAAQGRHLLDRPRRDLAHRHRGVEDQADLVGRQVGDAEQVLAAQEVATSRWRPKPGRPLKRMSRRIGSECPAS